MPAFLYAERDRCITIVVSPLVSLMEDQVGTWLNFCLNSLKVIELNIGAAKSILKIQ